MPTFYEWIIEFLQNDTPTGSLAVDIVRLARVFPWIKEIDSFADLVTLASESFIYERTQLGGDLSAKGFTAVNDLLWVEYCAETGHDLNGAITIDTSKLPWTQKKTARKRTVKK